MSQSLKYTATLLEQAREFLVQYYSESASNTGLSLEKRWDSIQDEINHSGTYTHTTEELTFGARVAWRNSNRCIGRLGWESLTLFDHRDLRHPDDIISATISYVKWAENSGKVRPAICIFAPSNPHTGQSIRFWNSKLIRYAGYSVHGSVIGDPDEIDRTNAFQNLGWHGNRQPFDLLPIVLQVPGYPVRWYNWSGLHDPLEVEIKHPWFNWFEELKLRWYGVPVISDMTLEIGGIHYTAAPFNGWFMGTEIGSRNLGDERRYNLLPTIAQRMQLDTKMKAALWKDRALTELNTAVLYSYRQKGVTIVDHHTAAEQFERFQRKEQQNRREVTADWSWVVPPTAGSTTTLFHQSWSNQIKTPNFFYTDKPFIKAYNSNAGQCPFHISSRK